MAALTLTELQDMQAALVRARASGTRRVRDSSGEEVEYRSDAELARALADVESRIAAMPSAAPNVIRFNTSKFGD
jgi:hypothetical protein